MSDKKRTWQSYKKENEELASLIIHALTNCPICLGTSKGATLAGQVVDCRYCGSLWHRYRNATGDQRIYSH